RDLFRFLESEAKPRHPGVDMDRGGKRLLRLFRVVVPFLDLAERAEHGARADILKSRSRAGVEAIQHVDCGLRDVRTDLERLVEERHKEGLAAGPGERRRNRFDTEAVGVGLDYSGAFRVS